MKFNNTLIEKAIKSKGYVWFNDDSKKGYDLNIVGIRNSTTGQKVTNLFDDYITVSYRDEKGNWVYKEWEATVDPGTKSMKEYSNKAGVARLVANQYRGAYIIGKHQGRYEALRQDKPVKVYRDPNKDMFYDEDVIQEGVFGINIHKAGSNSIYVDKWSEGCQVFKRAADFEEFMELCRKSAKIYGSRFTYTLLDSKDIK